MNETDLIIFVSGAAISLSFGAGYYYGKLRMLKRFSNQLDAIEHRRAKRFEAAEADFWPEFKLKLHGRN